MIKYGFSRLKRKNRNSIWCSITEIQTERKTDRQKERQKKEEEEGRKTDIRTKRTEREIGRKRNR